MSDKVNELIKYVEALVYYSQIYTVKGVQPVELPDHDTAWRGAQKWLWDNCKADEMGNYHIPPSENTGIRAIWVKASERTPEGHAADYHWRFAHSKKPIVCVFHIALGSLVMEYGNTRSRYNFDEVEWLDETGTAAQPTITPAEHEREVLAVGFDKVRRLFEGREWIIEGRGSYPYDDDRYKEEVRYMYEEFNNLFKDTWAQIKSHSSEYRKKIIEEYKRVVESKEVIAFAEWLEENTEIIRDSPKITLYRYCNKMNEWGNYTIDDIYTEYINL